VYIVRIDVCFAELPVAAARSQQGCRCVCVDAAYHASLSADATLHNSGNSCVQAECGLSCDAADVDSMTCGA
jgi:hypothetical protein